jgi:hypothetical protein
MEAAVFFTMMLGAIAANNATVMERYYGQYGYPAQYAQPVAVQSGWETPPAVYVPVAPARASVPGWVAGADVGSHVGAMVSASGPMIRCGGRTCAMGYDPRPVIAGALIGGLIGHAAATPPVPPTYRANVAPVPRSSSSSSREFVEHWQNFMDPSVSRSTAPLPGFGFGQRD